MPEPARSRLVLIDGSGYIFRAFFALPPLTDPKGVPVGAVFGFCNMLFRLVQDMPGDQLLVVFDKGKASFRDAIYADYKANRLEPPDDLVPQFKVVREATAAFGLPMVELDDYEADDIIATYAREARDAGREVIIVSSDKDLMQLIRQGVQMYDPMKQKAIDRDEVIARFGVGPELVRDVLALAGDTSDNVPGVPGIGVKTAAQLLQEFGDLEGLLANAATIKQPKRRENLLEHAEQARLSQQLVTLCDTVPSLAPLDQLHDGALDYWGLLEFAREHGFRSLAQRVEPLAESAARAPAPGALEPAPAAEYGTVHDLAPLDAWLDRASARGILAFDCTTTSQNVARAELVGISLAVEEGEACYVPLAHKDDFGTLAAGQPPRDEVLERLRAVLEDPAVLKVGHHLKYDRSVLARYGVQVAPYDDVMLLSYVIDGAGHGHGLDELAALHLDHTMMAYEAVCGSGRKQIPFDRVPAEQAAAYAAGCADVALRLHRVLKLELARGRRSRVYETIERPLVAVLAAMERRGIRVDPAMLRRLSADFTARMAELEAEAHRLAGRPFNLGSPKQLGEILFDEQGLESGRKTKTGSHGTAAGILEGLAAQGHELPKIVLDWRQLQKLTGTYTDALIQEIALDGRVHTSYAMAATSTGRLSSNDPNLQNIPIRTEEGRKIRRAFIADDGHLLLSADYSQIELRVLAHMAGIAALKEAFAKDIDVHAVTASQMFGVPIEGMDPLLRRNAKMINYGIIYGIGAFGLAQRLGIEFDVARRYIEAYFEQYPGIRDYMERAKDEARAHGYVTTLFGRMCATPEIKSGNPSRRGYAERAAINAPIQGTAADIMKRAMIRADRALSQSNLGARMLLQVHDELVFEVPADEVEPSADLIREVMAHAAHLDVPLVVDVGWGPNWDAAH
ncbi:MAG TPA: DNA polymerase I [Geminicoccaceae bacterium]|nr:DNA polymerase I [Geminicoccaceae bacterium]